MATIEDYRDAFDSGNVFTIPKLDDGDPEFTIAAQVGGGGTPGEAYVGWWFYELRIDGEVVAENNDYRCGMPQTAIQSAAAIVSLLSAAVQDSTVTPWSEAAMRFARKSDDRLNMWISDVEGEDE